MKPVRALVPPILLLVAVALGCSAPEPAKTAGSTDHVKVTRALLDAFRDVVYAHYDLQLLLEPAAFHPDEKTPEKELATARTAEAEARSRLVSALEAAGSTEARAQAGSLTGLMPILRDALVRTGRYAFIIADGEGESVSLAVVRLTRGREDRSITFFSEKFAYELYLHDETIIQDYPLYRALRLAVPGTAPILRPHVTAGRRIYIDLTVPQRIGRESFFPRVDAYRALARSAAEEDTIFIREAAARGAPGLLGVVKDVLRWRSLAGFYSTVQSQPEEEKLRRFIEDYEAREEIRAAAEAFELEKAHAAGDAKPAGARLATLERRAMLEAIVHGEPLGEVATTIGLAAAHVPGRPGADPSTEAVLWAAEAVTAGIELELSSHEPGAAGAPGTPAFKDPALEQVKALARVARASPEALQAAARAVFDRLPAPVTTATPGAKPPG